MTTLSGTLRVHPMDPRGRQTPAPADNADLQLTSFRGQLVDDNALLIGETVGIAYH